MCRPIHSIACFCFLFGFVPCSFTFAHTHSVRPINCLIPVGSTILMLAFIFLHYTMRCAPDAISIFVSEQPYPFDGNRTAMLLLFFYYSFFCFLLLLLLYKRVRSYFSCFWMVCFFMHPSFVVILAVTNKISSLVFKFSHFKLLWLEESPNRPNLKWISDTFVTLIQLIDSF